MEEIEEKIRPLIEKEGLFELKSVQQVNHRPHRYIIGPAHVKYASDKQGGRLDTTVCEKVECAHPNCHIPFKDHVYDTVAFVRLKRQGTQDEYKRILGDKELEKIMNANKVDGFAFVETEEKFRIV